MSSFLFRRSAAASASAARSFSTSSPRSLARVSIIGNLADTPEVQATSSGREVLRFAIASNSGTREHRKTSWFRVTSFAEGNKRDFLLSLPKGTQVYLEGDISTGSYVDQNGNNRTGISIVQRSIEILRRPYVEQGEHSTQTDQQTEQSQ